MLARIEALEGDIAAIDVQIETQLAPCADAAARLVCSPSTLDQRAAHAESPVLR
jgi:hypothetical protein